MCKCGVTGAGAGAGAEAEAGAGAGAGAEAGDYSSPSENFSSCWGEIGNFVLKIPPLIAGRPHHITLYL